MELLLGPTKEAPLGLDDERARKPFVLVQEDRLLIKWWEDYRQIKWSFIKELYGKERRPCTMKVEKAEGFSY